MLNYKRKKKKEPLLSVLYRSYKLFMRLPVSNDLKFRILLKLEWFFNRVCTEFSFFYYQAGNYPIKTKSLDFVLNHITDTMDILDLGCGKGEITFELSKKAKSAIGLDINKTVIEDAVNKFKRDNLSFLCQDAVHYINTTESRFHAVILSHFLEHVADPQQFLQTIVRISDHFFIEIPDLESTYLNLFRINTGATPVYTDEDHLYEFDREYIQKLFKDSGLTVLDSEFKFGVMKFWLANNKNHQNAQENL